MTTDTFPALVKALTTAVAEASASPDPDVRASWAESGVRAVLAGLPQPKPQHRFVGLAQRLLRPADHCCVIVEAALLPPGTPVYVRIAPEETLR